jgi:PAS domain S-box-containing protein
MSKRGMLVETLERETQFTWTASGGEIVGKSTRLWCAYTGQQEEAARSWGWIEALHPDDRERVRQLCSQAQEQKRFYETWYRIRNHEGIYRTFFIKYMPVLTRIGTLGGWVSQFVPATAEHLLLEYDGYWQTSLQHDLLFEQASVGMIYTSTDGRFLLVNDKFCSIVGYSREELIGRNLAEITPSEDVEAIRANMARDLAGEADPPPIDEKHHIRKDGEIIWVRLTPRLLRLPSGEPLCYFTQVEDITERKRAEEEQKQLLEFERALTDTYLREKQEFAALTHQLRAVFEALTDGIVFRDVEGKTLLMNSAARRMLEFGSEIDVTGVPYQNLYARYEVYDEHRRPLSIEQWPIARILRGEALSCEQAIDTIISLPSGREVQQACSGAPVYDRRGYMIGGVLVIRDVTEARQKERRVQQALDALLTIVEEMSCLPIQSNEPADAVPVQPLYIIGQSLTEIIHQVLQCHFAACILRKPQAGKLHLAGVSGLAAEEEQIYRMEVEQSFESDYFDIETICLRNNRVVIRDLVTQPPMKPHSDFGIRYRLIAPMLLDEQLVGTLVIGKSGTDVTYTPEETALVKAIAKLIVQVIERVRLTNEWMTRNRNHK